MTTLPAVRVWEYYATILRRTWKTEVVLGLLQPLVFLLGMGLGVGSLVNSRQSSVDALGGVPYVSFLAPGLLATTAMIVGSFESTYPVMAGFKWQGFFEAMAATRLSPMQIVRGMFLWLATRIGIFVAGVGVVLALFPDTRSWGLVLAVPAAVLCGLSFAAVIAAYAAVCQYDASFNYVQRFIITPLFLFGGAFYPIESLPVGLRPIAWITPLWHGVELCRGLSLHTMGLVTALGHLAVIAAYIVVGVAICRRLFIRRLYR